MSHTRQAKYFNDGSHKFFSPPEHPALLVAKARRNAFMAAQNAQIHLGQKDRASFIVPPLFFFMDQTQVTDLPASTNNSPAPRLKK